MFDGFPVHLTIKSESLQYQFNWNPFSISSIGLIKRAQLAVVPKRAKMSDSHWSIWTWFLDDLDLDDPYLTDAYSSPDPLLRATGDCAVIGLFFLLRPGEHVHSYQDNDTAPFRLQDVEFIFGIHCYNAATRALRAGGAMALLCARVDPLLVQLVGRWKSDAMLRYLHLQATNMHDLATRMLSGGEFKLLPNQTLPPQALSLLASCTAAESAETA
jgi:hypothetical protein